MRMPLALCLAAALSLASAPVAAQTAIAPSADAAAAPSVPPAPANAARAAAPASAPLGVLLRLNPDLARPLRYEITARPGDPDRLVSFARHAALGMAIGGVVGFAWGMTNRDNDAFGLSPTIETIIGVGVGGFAGTGLFLVKDLR